jgi:hypothetical protein
LREKSGYVWFSGSRLRACGGGLAWWITWWWWCTGWGNWCGTTPMRGWCPGTSWARPPCPYIVFPSFPLRCHHSFASDLNHPTLPGPPNAPHRRRGQTGPVQIASRKARPTFDTITAAGGRKIQRSSPRKGTRRNHPQACRRARAQQRALIGQRGASKHSWLWIAHFVCASREAPCLMTLV